MVSLRTTNMRASAKLQQDVRAVYTPTITGFEIPNALMY